jgi:hypothetical protein
MKEAWPVASRFPERLVARGADVTDERNARDVVEAAVGCLGRPAARPGRRASEI